MRYLNKILLVIAFLASSPLLANQDVKGSQDYPGIGRLEGSYIKTYKAVDFDEYPLVTYAVMNDEDKKKRIKLEGKVTRISYWAPENVSVLEAQRNYENQLKDTGFELLFTCHRDECGGRRLRDTIEQYIMLWPEYRYAVAKMTTETSEMYVTVATTIDGSHIAKTQLAVIETKAMENKMIDASAMSRGIGGEGRVALYGILFDLDAASIKSESKPTLEQITTLLNNEPDLELVIVGHTDNQGDLKYNMELSKRRAESIKTALEGEYGVDGNRLSAWGVGYLSPVATNRNEAGRAKNRRVELVEK
jgi:OOP family OmpA-OmpF porin